MNDFFSFEGTFFFARYLDVCVFDCKHWKLIPDPLMILIKLRCSEISSVLDEDVYHF